MTAADLLDAVDARLLGLSPRVQAVTGSATIQGSRATPAQATIKTPSPGQPERGIVRYSLELPSSINRNLTREGEQGVPGGMILRDSLIVALTYPVSISDPRASRSELLDAERAVLTTLTDPAWARSMRLSYAGTQRTLSPPTSGGHATIALTFTCDRQFP